MVAKARTAADFKAVHDPETVIPNKIRAALTAMLKEGTEHWEYEADFMKRAGINQTQVSTFREQFADHIVHTSHAAGRQPKRVWFADPKVAKRLGGGKKE